MTNKQKPIDKRDSDKKQNKKEIVLKVSNVQIIGSFTCTCGYKINNTNLAFIFYCPCCGRDVNLAIKVLETFKNPQESLSFRQEYNWYL